ncbi:MAG: CaiB/BaiF CoA-transferase family protein [Pseudomonadota bacterium]|nr:CaiB/BaiF CoA-transferase family protein [Pseudomonadota bacterium]
MTNRQPLDHLRVLDMSRILAGPWCGQTFADLGAEVIKIERPESGDDTRVWGPPFMSDAAGNETGTAAYFLAANRGKKSVTVDITKPEGQAIIRSLVAECDVLLENYKVDGLKKYGLDYESLSQLNPKLVYCSITGFGQTGPYCQRAGYDFLIQAMGGLMSVTGEAENKPGGGPQKIGVALTDILTGLYTVIGALAALAWRDKTGKGQHVDMSLLDVTVAAMANQAMNYLIADEVPKMMGNAHPNIVPYEAYRAADHYIILAVGNDAQFRRFCEIADRLDLCDDERFATNRNRVENRDELGSILHEIIEAKPRDFWLEELEKVGVPCGPINNLAQVFNDPHVIARGTKTNLMHPEAGVLPTVANPIRFSASPIAHERAPPLLGEDNDEVLKKLLNLSSNEIKLLRDREII